MKLPSNSLLSSFGEILWRAMAHVKPLDDDTKTQKKLQVGSASFILCSAEAVEAKAFPRLLARSSSGKRLQ